MKKQNLSIVRESIVKTVIENCTSIKFTGTKKLTDNSYLIYFDAMPLYEYMDKIENELVKITNQFHISKSDDMNAKNVFNVLAQSANEFDDVGYLTIRYDYSKFRMNNL
jgi:hypothetical protein